MVLIPGLSDLERASLDPPKSKKKPGYHWPHADDPEGRQDVPHGFQTSAAPGEAGGLNPPKPPLRNGNRLGKERTDLVKAGGRTRQTASRLKELRLAAGMTQVQLQAACSTSYEVIQKAERGYLLQLRTGTVLRLAAALNCGAADIFPILGERLNRL